MHMRCENDFAVQIQQIVEAVIFFRRGIEIVDDEQHTFAERSQQFHIPAIAFILICHDRIAEYICNDCFQAAPVEVKPEMIVFRFMLLRIGTDKFALSDTCNTCDDHRGIVFYQGMQFCKLRLSSAEVAAGSNVLAVCKQGIPERNSIGCIT